MWFTKFGEYVNRGLKEASLMALIFSLIPFLGWVGIVIMCLITLRKGAQQGLVVLAATLIPSVVLLAMGVNVPWVIATLCSSVLAWILALALRESGSWGQVLLVSMISAVVVVVGLHLLMPDLHGYWQSLLQGIYQQADKEAAAVMKLPKDMSLESYIGMVAKGLTPILVFTQVMMALVNLLIARWWQSHLFNPGGLVKELFQTRLNFWATVILVATAVVIYMGVNAGWDVLPTEVAIFSLAGLVAFHNMMRYRKAKTAMLWLFYGLVVLLFPYSIVIIAGLGIANTFIDFSAKQAHPTKNGE